MPCRVECLWRIFVDVSFLLRNEPWDVCFTPWSHNAAAEEEQIGSLKRGRRADSHPPSIQHLRIAKETPDSAGYAAKGNALSISKGHLNISPGHEG